MPGGDNPTLDGLAKNILPGEAHLRESAGKTMKAIFKALWGKDIDPDRTFFISADANPSLEGPFRAMIAAKTSLTDALIENMQDPVPGKGRYVAWAPKMPPLRLQDSIEIKLGPVPIPPYMRTPSHTDTRTFNGIWKANDDGSIGPDLTSDNRLAIPPKQVYEQIWKAEFQSKYTSELDAFWAKESASYATAVKAAFLKAAYRQHADQSLSDSAFSLAKMASGVEKEHWADLTVADLGKSMRPNPMVETGLLKIHGYKSNDLMYIRDRNSGQTLLHIPGNPSPIHSFADMQAMKNWVAATCREGHDAKDEDTKYLKMRAWALHFSNKDRGDGFPNVGVDTALMGLAKWPERHQIGGGLFSGFDGFYAPLKVVGTESVTDPFREIADRTKTRTYDDAASEITSKGDWRARAALGVLNQVNIVLLPMALLFPPAGAVAYGITGSIQAGIGLDMLAKGKKEAGENIFWGALNAVPLAAGGINKVTKILPKGVPAAAPAVLKTTTETLARTEDLLRTGAREPLPDVAGEIRGTVTGDADVPNMAGNSTEQGREAELKGSDSSPQRPVTVPGSVPPEGTSASDPATGAITDSRRLELSFGETQTIDSFIERAKKGSSKSTAAEDGAIQKAATNGSALYDEARRTLEGSRLPRPPAAELPANPTDRQLVRSMLDGADGLVVGENHSAPESREFFMNNMQALADEGVRTLYTELPVERYGPSLDVFNATGYIDDKLASIPRDKAASPKLVDVFREARRHNIKVVAADSLVASDYGGNGGHQSLERRVFAFNRHATDVIRSTQQAEGSGKFAALFGAAHAGPAKVNNVAVPGIAETTGARSLRIIPAISQKATRPFAKGISKVSVNADGTSLSTTSDIVIPATRQPGVGTVATGEAIPPGAPSPATIDRNDLSYMGDGLYASSQRDGAFVNIGGSWYRGVRQGTPNAVKVVDEANAFNFRNNTYAVRDTDGRWRFAGREGLAGGNPSSVAAKAPPPLPIDESFRTLRTSAAGSPDAEGIYTYGDNRYVRLEGLRDKVVAVGKGEDGKLRIVQKDSGKASGPPLQGTPGKPGKGGEITFDTALSDPGDGAVPDPATSSQRFELSKDDAEELERLSWFEDEGLEEKEKAKLKELRAEASAKGEALIEEAYRRLPASRMKSPPALDVSPDLADADLVKRMLSDVEGMVVGENHLDANPRLFVLNNMDRLSRAGVRTMYLELDVETYGDAIKEFNATGKVTEPLENMAEDDENPISLLTVMREARSNGITLVPTDTVTASTEGGNGATSAVRRIWAYNMHATDVIRTHQASGKGGKFVALAGLRHVAETRVGGVTVPGLGETTGARSITFNQATYRMGDPPRPDVMRQSVISPSSVDTELLQKDGDMYTLQGSGKSFVKLGKDYYRAVATSNKDVVAIVDPESGSPFGYPAYCTRDTKGTWRVAPPSAMDVDATPANTPAEAQGKLARLANMTPLDARAAAVGIGATISIGILQSRSNATAFQGIRDYKQGDRALINKVLRLGTSLDQTKDFMHDFKQLHGYRGTSYRTVPIRGRVAEKLLAPGDRTFVDLGIQSASTQPANSSRWGTNVRGRKAADRSEMTATFVFDPSVPQKNLSTAAHPDHVAVPPGTRLRVVSTLRKGNHIYVYMTAAPTSGTLRVTDLQTGKESKQRGVPRRPFVD